MTSCRSRLADRSCGTLLLATTDKFLARQHQVPRDDVGGYEYRNNDFSIPDEDVARSVPLLAPRLAAGGALLHDDEIDYRDPDGQLFADVAAFLRALIVLRAP